MSEKITVFCVPFAGGNKYAYQNFERQCPQHINLVTIEYPGRGSRSREKLIIDCSSLAEDICQKINSCRPSRYAIYGHSMGGLIAWLVIHKINNSDLPMPSDLFITGMPGPSSLAWQKKIVHKMSFPELLAAVRGMQDDETVVDILEDETTRNYFEPILRADFQASENYRYNKVPILDVPITVITGTQEPWTAAEITSWQLETSQSVGFHQMTGKHFFIFNHAESILKIISNQLYKSNILMNSL